MLLRKAILATAFVGAAATVAVTACSKEDEDEDKVVLSAEQRADANKAATIGLSNGVDKGAGDSGLRLSRAQKSQVRAMFAAAKRSNARSLDARLLQDDGGIDPADFCTAISDSCTGELNQDLPADEDGSTCKTTSCTDGTTMTCTSPSTSGKCGDVTYTLAESNITTNLKCTSNADQTLTMAVTADLASSISGGTITTAVPLTCHVALSIKFDFAADDGDDGADVDLGCDSGTEFSCTVGDDTLTCADIQKQIDEQSCD
jgi:hypothetical protein